MAEAVAPTNRYERRRQRNREALLAAAIELFQQHGVRATRVEAICERADVAPRTFFNHFETREHLYRAIAWRRADEIARLLDAQVDDGRSFAARLTALGSEIADYLAGRPAYRELVAEMLALRASGGHEAGRRIARALRRFVEEGVARGEVTERHAPEVLADLLLGAITTALERWCTDPDYDLTAGLARATRALLDLCDPRRLPA